MTESFRPRDQHRVEHRVRGGLGIRLSRGGDNFMRRTPCSDCSLDGIYHCQPGERLTDCLGGAEHFSERELIDSARHSHDGGERLESPHGVNELEAVPAQHVDVSQDNIRSVRVQFEHGLACIGDATHEEPAGLEENLQRIQQCLVVIDDEHSTLAARRRNVQCCH